MIISRIILSTLFVLLLCPSTWANKPNVIFILADDLGYADLSCYGQESFETPRIDQMAREGMKFTQHYAGSTVCAPSRACLLTGQHTGHVYQRANKKNLSFRQDPKDGCIAKSLKEAGYHTAMIGKSGLSCSTDNLDLPAQKGFDYFFGFVSHGAAHRYYPETLYRNGEAVNYPGNHGKEGISYTGDLFLDDAIGYIERVAKTDKPFFLHLALQQPHLDLQVPTEWREPFLGKFKEKPIGSAKSHFRREENPKATFAGMITHLDMSVGKVLDLLQELGIAENTLVIFASDNGAVTTGGWTYKNFNSSGELRGCKRDLYEGGVRVPMIAWQPGSIQPGTTSDHVSTFWDFAPTVCELVGIAAPDKTDGISYLPTLYGRSGQAEHDNLYWEFYEQGGKQAVRMGDWKGVRLKILKGKTKFELYDLSNDLGEKNDIADQHPEIVAKIKAIMDQEHVPTKLFKMKPAQ